MAEEQPPNSPTGVAAATHQASGPDSTAIADQQIAGLQELIELAEDSMIETAAPVVQDEQSGGVARLRRGLGDQLGR